MSVSESHIHTLADLAWGPMTSKEAAVWLGTSYDGFRGLAPSLPRQHIPGLGYRYFRSELYEWSRNPGSAEADTRAGSDRPNSSHPVATGSHTPPREVTSITDNVQRGGKRPKVERLI